MAANVSTPRRTRQSAPGSGHVRVRLLVFAILLSGLLPTIAPVGTVHDVEASDASSSAEAAFQRTWERTDRPVADGDVQRTWMWGPEPTSVLLEEAYADAPGGKRWVQYYDKARMEVTDPGADATNPWYVTNGLIARELITGSMQVGDHRFEQYDPAMTNVAGDQHDQQAPTYATFTGLLQANAHPDHAPIVERLNRDGSVQVDASLAEWGATYAVRVTVGEGGIERQIASPFWDFINSSGPVYAEGRLTQAALFADPFYSTGLPLTEPYWARVLVNNQPQDVLLQCFERRCLTWTPLNPSGFQTESANVGAHYARWRYGKQPPTAPEPPAGSSCAARGGSSVTVGNATELQAALDAAAPASTIRLKSGTYRGTFRITRSGRADAPIALCGAEGTMLEGTSTASGTGIRIEGDYWVIEGLTLRTYLKGVEAYGTSGTTIRGLTISNVGQEAIHLRATSSDNVVERNQIRDTGRQRPEWGEGIYIGSDSRQWCNDGNCAGDASDNNIVQFNTIGPGVTAELIDIKEGTRGGTIRGNVLVGNGSQTASGVDALVSIKGNDWLIVGNVGERAPEHGMRVNTDEIDGWGNGNIFVDNTLNVQADGFGFRVPLDSDGQPLPNVVACANDVSNAGAGFANIPCTADVPTGR